MHNLVAHIAIIGRLHLMPGILPVKLGPSNSIFYVSHSFKDVVEFPNSKIKVDISECILFKVEHIGRTDIDLKDFKFFDEILELSLSAISEATLWFKANDAIGEVTSYIRQFGKADVKFFAAENQVDSIGYISPLFQLSHSDASLISGFLPNMVVSNGPEKNPIPPITRRVMSSLDLINLGFYTE